MSTAMPFRHVGDDLLGDGTPMPISALSAGSNIESVDVIKKQCEGKDIPIEIFPHPCYTKNLCDDSLVKN